MRTCTEGRFFVRDGQRLYYRHWPALSPRRRGALVLLHRGHEHSGRLQHVVDELELLDFDCFAYDARGHGRSPGPRGDSPGVGTAIADLQCFIDHLVDVHGVGPQQVAVIGQSLSAVLLAAWVHDYAPRIRAMVLVAPAFRIKLYVPFARSLLAAALKVRANLYVSSYVKARLLTHDPERIASYESDPLIVRAVSVRTLVGLDRLAQRIVADAKTITVPAQVLISGRDLVVDDGPQRVFHERLGSSAKSLHTFPGLYHDTLGELARGPVLAAVRAFLLARFDAPLERPSFDSDAGCACTREEARRLATALPRWSLKGLYWRSIRASSALAARRSTGIGIGQRAGFDSGASLDHVYRNQPHGQGVLGRVIDRIYLDAAGWRGIRERKLHIEIAIREAVESLRAAERPVRILDIAAGPGRYVLDALDRQNRPDWVELRDHCARNVIVGRALLADRGWSDIANYRRADAFAELSPGESERSPRKPFTLGIVSGLYELYADNGRVRRSLNRLAREIAPGGFLVYTGQPWHPQLEFIARVLTRERDGAPWVMRRRPQAELDALVESAGFRKVAQRIDEQGMFTVCIAKRVANCRSGRDENVLARERAGFEATA